jgi:hypothetical protein
MRTLHDLCSAQLATIQGGLPNFYITNVTDRYSINSSGNNTVEVGGASSFSFRDNRINTRDYSRSIYNNISILT